MSDQQTASANTDLLLAVLIALGAVAYKFSQTEEFLVLEQTLPRTILLLAIFLAAFTAFVLVLTRVIKRRLALFKERAEREEREQSLLQQLDTLRRTTYEDSHDATKAYVAAEFILRELPKQYRARARYTRHRLLEKIRHLSDEEFNTAQEKRDRAEDTERLSAYFTKHKRTTLPRWALHYDQELISTATKEYERLKEQEYDPPPALPIDEFLMEHRFYHANKVSPQQRVALLSNGYRFIPFIHLDGKPGNNLIIRNNPEKESDYHFCMKHLFSELDEHARLEMSFGGQRFDIVYERGLNRVAVEIETGKNKSEHLRKKVAALNQYFDHWIIVTTRKNKPQYKQYVDSEKNFCLSAKQAVERLHHLLTPLTHSKPTAAKTATHRKKPNEPRDKPPDGCTTV